MRLFEIKRDFLFEVCIVLSQFGLALYSCHRYKSYYRDCLGKCVAFKKQQSFYMT